MAADMGLVGEWIWSADDKHESRALALTRYAAHRGTLPVLLSAIERARPKA